MKAENAAVVNADPAAKAAWLDWLDHFASEPSMPKLRRNWESAMVQMTMGADQRMLDKAMHNGRMLYKALSRSHGKPGLPKGARLTDKAMWWFFAWRYAEHRTRVASRRLAG